MAYIDLFAVLLTFSPESPLFLFPLHQHILLRLIPFLVFHLESTCGGDTPRLGFKGIDGQVEEGGVVSPYKLLPSYLAG